MAEEIGRNIVSLLNEIVNDEMLVQLIANRNEYPFEKAIQTPAYDMIFDSVFPFPFEASAISESKIQLRVYVPKIKFNNRAMETSFICFDVITPVDYKDEKNNSITSHWIISDEKGRRLIRPLEIIERLRYLFNGKKFCGVGKMSFKDASFYHINDKFNGYRIIVEIITANSLKRV